MKVRDIHIGWQLAMGPLLAALVGCSGDEPGGSYIEMPVHISIPVEGTASRAVGDPGQEETWEFPTKAYIFFCTSPLENAAACDNVTIADIDLNPTNWDPLNPDAEDEYVYQGYNIYEYQGSVTIRLPEDQKTGRVYAVVSKGSVDIYNRNDEVSVSSSLTEEQVKGLTFNVPTTGQSDFLKNLYSSPYNKTISDSDKRYYGTVLNITDKQPQLDLICYHVGAKLDVMWNVTSTYPLETLEIQDLYSQNCSLFDPGRNSGVETADKTLYAETYSTSVGNQWYGRTSFYVVNSQKRESLALQLNSVERTLNENEFSTSSYNSDYAPWIRVQLDISRDLTPPTSNRKNPSGIR